MARIISTGEAANRAAVAIDLADALATMPHGTNPDVVAALPDSGWAKAAALAGCAPNYVPSDATRATVVGIVRRRAERPTDPFAGLPQ